MMLYGKVIHADKAMKAAAKGKPVSLVPSDWVLMRISPNGEQTELAKNVLAFDVSPTGAIAFTNGSQVFELNDQGTATPICAQRMIERVLVLS